MRSSGLGNGFVDLPERSQVKFTPTATGYAALNLTFYEADAQSAAEGRLQVHGWHRPPAPDGAALA